MPTVRSNPNLPFFISFPIPTVSPFLYAPQLLSLSHSLLSAVADLRAARGDLALANKLDRALRFGFWRMVWATAWRWREFPLTEPYGAVSVMNELIRGLTKLTRLKSTSERSAWAAQNNQNVLAMSKSKSLSCKLLKAFGQSGVVREVMETVQKEVVEGGMIRDCLELGSNDFKALIQVVKDLVLQFYPVSDKVHILSRL